MTNCDRHSVNPLSSPLKEWEEEGKRLTSWTVKNSSLSNTNNERKYYKIYKTDIGFPCMRSGGL